ncbi:MAG: lytic transglycosylase domain-containing protein, partial [Eubacteriales bacterium]
PFPETRSYVLRVTYYYGEYNKLYGAGSSSTSPPADTSSDNNNVTTAGSTGTSTAITDINNRPITWITRGPDERGRIFVNELACYAWAKEYHELYYGDIDPLLVMAIIKTESDFVVNAVSSAGAYGIMQIMPDTYYIDIKPSIDLSEDFEYLLEDPQFALKCGMYYLHWLYADSRGLNNSMINVIAAYHGGCNTVSAWLSTDGLSADGELIVSEIPIEKTAKYVEKVLANYEYYKTLFN